MKNPELAPKSKNIYRSVFDQMVYGAALHKVVTDKKGRAIDYVFLLVNPSFERLTGLNAKDIIGKTARKVLPNIETDPANWISKYGDVGLGGKDISFEEYSRHLNKWYSVYAYCVEKGFFVSIFEDITERKQLEQELKFSEHRYKTLYKNAPLPYHSLDEEGRFMEINPAWTATLGFEPKEVIGEFYSDFLHPDWKPHFQKKFPDFLKKGSVHTTFKIRHKSGDYLDIDLRGNIGHHMDGTFKQTNCVFQNITSTKKAQEELLKNQFYLSKAQEIGTIGTWEIDLQENTIIWTQENYRIFGIPPGTEVNYDLFLSCVHPDDRAYVEAEWTAAVKGKPYDIEHRLLHGKEVKWVREKADFQYDESGNCNTAIGVTQDITEQKMAEERIRESEEKYRALYENAPLPYQSLNEDGTFRDVNPAWLSTLGYTREEVIGKKYADFLHPDWEAHFKKSFPEFKKRGYVSDVQFRIRHKKGNYLDIAFEGCIGYHPDGSFKQTYCVFQDITLRKESEQRLLENEHKLSTILETALDGYWIVDTKGNIMEVNNAYSLKSGYTRAELLNMNVSEIEADDTPEVIANRITTIVKKGGLQFESRHRRKNGSIFNVEMSVKYLSFEGGQMVCFIHDITKRKRDELELRLNEQRLDTLVQLNQMTDVELESVYDLILGKAIELTKSKVGFLGFVDEDETSASLYNWSDSLKKPYENIEKMAEVSVTDSGLWGEVIRTKDTVLINNYKAINSSEKGLPPGHLEFRNYLSIPVISRGKVVRFISVSNKDGDYTDIDAKQLSLLVYGMWKYTEQRKEKEELKIAKNKAEEADRLKSAFLANMSHEIRTPMNGILGFTNLLKKPDLSGEKQKDYIEIIRKSGDRMLNTVNDIIEISKIETGQVGINISDVNLKEICEYLYLFFKPEADSKQIQLNITNSLDEHQIHIRTDEAKLNSILTNLIKNALKYSNEGSVELGCKIKGQHLEFYIKDTGTGIPEERLEAIFDRFVQADIEDKQAQEGSGLGLAISKSFVEMLGGRIWIESKLGTGTIVYFTIDCLPIKSKEMRNKTDKKAKIKKSDRKKLILVVEDDEVSYLLIENILSPENHRLLWAKNGLEAIELFTTNKEIDFILMDLKMPVMGGLEATRQIRKLDGKIPIIAQTAYALESDREKALEAGCTDYISKPIEYDYFEKMINTLE